MDILTIIGVIIGFAAIIGGNFLEGGHLSALVNGPAALIVLGGTLGAAILQTPKDVLFRSVKLFVWMIRPPSDDFDGSTALENMLKPPNNYIIMGVCILIILIIIIASVGGGSPEPYYDDYYY